MRDERTVFEIFCIYAPEDEAYLKRLETYLDPWRQQGLIVIRHRGIIPAGAIVEEEVRMSLELASFILLLVSPDLLTSETYNKDIQHIMELYASGRTKVIPIIIQSVDWSNTPFRQLQMLPRDGRPIASFSQASSEKAWLDVISELGQLMGLRNPYRWLSTIPDRSSSNLPDAYLSASQQAIAKVERADPANIQEVAASQLAIVNSYYQSGLEQSQQSFHWSLIWGGIGLVFFIAAVSFLLLHQSNEVALASGLGGAVVEVLAGTFLYLYKHASDQLAAFRSSLEGTQRLLLANSMCERLEGEIEQTTRAELIRLVVGSALNGPVPMLADNNKDEIPAKL
jgi:hypothetical protein